MNVLLAGSGWVLAALMLGLWLGERGRRLDAQRREGVLPVDRPLKPVVTPAPADAARVPAAVTEGFSQAKDRYVAEAVAEGYDPDDAARDFDKMLVQLNTDQL